LTDVNVLPEYSPMGADQSLRDKRIRLNDVAAAANVSIATVDRVLNKRGGVKEETVRHVLKVAERLRYAPDQNAQRLRLWGRDGAPSFSIAFPTARFAFFQKLWRSFENYARRSELGIAVSLREMEEISVSSLVNFFERVAPLYDGVAVVAFDHPAVVEAINNYCAGGGKVVCIVSDLPRSSRQSFVGEDSLAAGRTAAYLTGRLVEKEQGKVAVLHGPLGQKDHADRLWGFQTLLAAEYPGLELVRLTQNVFDEAGCRTLLEPILREHPDLVAIYGMCAEIDGLVAALNISGRKSDVVFIAHE
jgi:LacI family transcriptional regulator